MSCLKRTHIVNWQLAIIGTNEHFLPFMEFNRHNLQCLIERAGTLYDNFANEIKNCISLCRLCSENGRYCDVAGAPYEEKENLIAIRDLLKEVQNKLIYLQSLDYWQPKDRHAAISRLEESRLRLVEKVTHHPGRRFGVLRELNAFLARDKDDCHWNFKGTTRKNAKTKFQKRKRSITGFLICCIKILFNPLRWQKAVVFAVKLLAVSASISSTIQFCENRHKLSSSGKNFSVCIKSANQESENPQLAISKKTLDVCYGMG